MTVLYFAIALTVFLMLAFNWRALHRHHKQDLYVARLPEALLRVVVAMMQMTAALANTAESIARLNTALGVKK